MQVWKTRKEKATVDTTKVIEVLTTPPYHRLPLDGGAEDERALRCRVHRQDQGRIGAGGLGRLLEQQRAAFDYAGMLATVIALIVVSLIVDMVSASARRSLR